MANIQVRPLPLAEIVRRIDASDGFAFARIGDGGFYCLQGHQGANCDGVVYTAHQAAALMEFLRNPRVTHGIAQIAFHRANAAVWLDRQGIGVEWYDAEAIHKASETGKLWPFVQTLHTHRVVMVGPAHLRRLKGFPVVSFVETHPTKAFEQVNELQAAILAEVAAKRADVVLISAGQGAAPTLVSRLAGIVTVLDVGSVWDMYVGVLSRSGPKRMGRARIEELGRMNFRQEIGAWWTN